ncbi:MAG: phosphoglucosamine mutase [Elusimicrobiota bacterium]
MAPTAPLLFGTDGVRGIAGEAPLQKSFIRHLGAAAAITYKQHVPDCPPVFLLGRDTRSSGPWIAQAFAEGAATEGVHVLDVGVVPTPAIAYLVPKRKLMGGVMISASHNPSEFNGVKLFNPQGRKCPDTWERFIEKQVAEMTPLKKAKVKRFRDTKAVQEYLDFLHQSVPLRPSLDGLTLVVDCSNGSLSHIAPHFLRSSGARVIAIGDKPNGRNINAGLGSQHPEKLQRLVVAKKADGGIAFDGDADRVIFCDEKGRLLDGDFILACAARFLKEEKRLKGNAVVVTVMANLGLMKALESWGLEAVATPVGDRWVSDKLEENDYVIGGEQSGHIIFHEFLPTGDGLLTALQVLSMLRQRRHPLSWVYSLFKRYPQVLLNVRVKEKKPLENCPTLQNRIDHACRELAEQGRVFIRYSGTEPLLRIMMEGPDEARLQALAHSVADEAKKVLGAGS